MSRRTTKTLRAMPMLVLFLVLPSYRLAAQQNSIPDSSQVPEANQNGYSYPKCIYCPRAPYTREALAQKFQGTMTLVVVVTSQGRAENIKVVSPLPYGLTEGAIEAVKKWKFKPATGPDGKPATVRQKIEVVFHTSKSCQEVGCY